MTPAPDTGQSEKTRVEPGSRVTCVPRRQAGADLGDASGYQRGRGCHLGLCGSFCRDRSLCAYESSIVITKTKEEEAQKANNGTEPLASDFFFFFFLFRYLLLFIICLLYFNYVVFYLTLLNTEILLIQKIQIR